VNYKNYDPKYFFLQIGVVIWEVQFIECSTISGVNINLPCSKAVNFGSRMTVNSDESVPQFRERRTIRSFLSKNDVILSRILMESYSDRSKKEQSKTHFIGLWNISERFLSRCGNVFQSGRKHSVTMQNGKQCVLLYSERFYSLTNTFTKLRNAFFK
jgi:hypothetical protein